MDTVSRREFLATSTMLLSARSYSRILGANDRIQIGQIGCGHRSAGHRQMLKLSAATDPNFDLRSVCDLWSVNRERAADDVQRLFGHRPKTYQYSEEMLADPGSGRRDDRHRRSPARADPGRGGARGQGLLLREADGEHAGRRQAGARRGHGQRARRADGLAVAELSLSAARARDRSAAASWARSSRSARAGTSTGRAGTCRRTPNIAAIREQDTDWKRWLLGRARAPVRSAHLLRVPHLQGFLRAASPTSGTATARGWRISISTRSSPTTPCRTAASSPGTTCARTRTRSSASRRSPKSEVLYTYSTTFGNAYGDHTIIRGTHGTLYSPGGEGSPQWWFLAGDEQRLGIERRLRSAARARRSRNR